MHVAPHEPLRCLASPPVNTKKKQSRHGTRALVNAAFGGNDR